jgi:hypothetical protein
MNVQWLELDEGLAEENLMNYNNPSRLDTLLEQMYIQVATVGGPVHLQLSTVRPSFPRMDVVFVHRSGPDYQS